MGAIEKVVLRPDTWDVSPALVELAIELFHRQKPDEPFGIPAATEAIREALKWVLRKMCSAVHHGHPPRDSRTALTKHDRLHCQFVAQFQSGPYSYLYPSDRKGERFMVELYKALDQRIRKEKKLLPVYEERGHKILVIGAVKEEDGEIFLRIFAAPQTAKR